MTKTKRSIPHTISGRTEAKLSHLQFRVIGVMMEQFTVSKVGSILY